MKNGDWNWLSVDNRKKMFNKSKKYEGRHHGKLLDCHTLAAGDSESPSLEGIHNLFKFQKAS